MVHLTRTTHCLAADSEGTLACATVADTPLGARFTTAEPVGSALEMPADQLRARLPKVRKGDALVFVIPSELASLRPFTITSKQWPGAKDDVVASVATLFPLTPDDARLGLIDLAADPDDDAPARACLVGASAAALRPWIEHLRAALGRAPDAILAPVQCLPALGLQREAGVRVLEPAGVGETVEHTLAFALPTDIARAPSNDDRVATYRLPGAEGPPHAHGVSLTDLALAGALTPTVSRRHAAPLQGAMPSARSRWLLPACALLLAIGAVWGALVAGDARTRTRLQEIAQESAALEPDALRVSALRRDALAHQALLDNAIAPTLARWTETLPDLEAARAAIPEHAWLFDIELTPTTIDVSGVALEPRDVLRRIESSTAFTGARFVTPPSPASQYEGELFHIVASRTSTPEETPR